MTSNLPPKHRALVLDAKGADFQLKSIATPQVGLGNAIIRVEAAGILSYHREIYNGARQYNFPTPLVGGTSAVGRIAALGPDSTSLKLGQLVFADCVIHSRDDPDSLFMTAIHEGTTDGSKKLSHDVWRDGAFAEYMKIPLENCIPLDEEKLCKGLGYTPQELMYICYPLVAYGGLRDINVQPGETVVVSPATGGFGGAGVMTAIAMGCRVIAMGRNEKELARLKELVLKGSPKANIETVKITGDEMADAQTLMSFGTIDAAIDFSPPDAIKSPHVRSAMAALRRNGRVSLMGFNEIVRSPFIVFRNLTLKGKLMYEREDMLLFVKMLELGLFPRGKDFVDLKIYKLEDWKEALDVATEWAGIGKYVTFAP